MPRWKRVVVEYKPDGSEVTESDRGAEQLLRKRIAARYPHHAVLGEEFGGEEQRDAEHLWLIDPIDGTASFAIGLPLLSSAWHSLRGCDRGACTQRNDIRCQRPRLLVSL